MKSILVTGGAGFIGSHLSLALAETKAKIYCVDNFFSCAEKNKEYLSKVNNIEIINHDICNPIDLKVDEIYNLACPASPIHYQKDPVKTVQTNVVGTFNMLELAKKNSAKIFQASTSEVYGSPTVHPQTEDYWGNVNPVGVRSCYDEGKRCAETLFFDYHRQFNLEIKVMRIFNTYGPYMSLNDGRVVSNFIIQALKNENITINGDGTQTRSFCYVDDLVSGIIKFMDTNNKVTGPLNFGNPHEVMIKDLAEFIIMLTGSKSKVQFQPMPQDDPERRKPDISKTKNLVNWTPTTELKDGLLKTIDYFSSIIS